MGVVWGVGDAVLVWSGRREPESRDSNKVRE